MCLNQDRGWKLRQMDSLMPTLNDPYRQGRMTWTEQGKGWIGRPAERAWDGVDPRTRSVASVTWTIRRAAEPPMVFIEVDGESLTRPAPTPVER